MLYLFQTTRKYTLSHLLKERRTTTNAETVTSDAGKAELLVENLYKNRKLTELLGTT